MYQNSIKCMPDMGNEQCHIINKCTETHCISVALQKPSTA